MLASAQTPVAETDRGPSAAGGERFCALTRTAKPADDMIRFVVGPDGAGEDLEPAPCLLRLRAGVLELTLDG